MIGAAKVLDEIGKFYVPGVIAHYEKMPIDPWQKLFDDYEKILLSGADWPEIDRAGLKCIQQAKNLVDHYSKHSPAAPLTPRDAFILGDEERVKDWQSAQAHSCYICEEKTGLSFESGTDKMVRVVCLEHKSSKA